ncbi:unnamed protein product [Soboliphyme baturini]|uniref:Separase n=1 Tax=Soboliphyme baturini TaxID=241478 RepID=A0A183ICY8_9BILA|nr:unnamed protein product [Soboliphyme baturini]
MNQPSSTSSATPIRRRRITNSVFDRFQDFEAESELQSFEMTGQSSSLLTGKRKQLEMLFRSPMEIMHLGNFETVYHDSAEGKRVSSYYKVHEFPFIGIIDPRTGELMEALKIDDPLCFCDRVTSFLDKHPSLSDSVPSPDVHADSASPVSPPDRKRKRSQTMEQHAAADSTKSLSQAKASYGTQLLHNSFLQNTFESKMAIRRLLKISSKNLMDLIIPYDCALQTAKALDKVGFPESFSTSHLNGAWSER